MKNILFVFIFFLFSSASFCQNNKFYKLEWKLKPDQIIIYKTQTERVDSSKYQRFQLDIDKIIESMPDSLKQKMAGEDSIGYSKAKEFFESMNSIDDNYNLYSVLSKEQDGSIGVKMIMKKTMETKESLMDSLMQMFTQLNDGVVLRGKLNKDGSIGSFYLSQPQKNTLAMYFELPSRPVQIGDHWSLEVNLLEFDQNFICDKSEKRNDIELIDVKEINGEQIAYIKYDIYEMVEGNFNNPLSKKTIPTFMQMSFSGINEFSITNGKWKKFNCMSKSESSGFSKLYSAKTDIMVPVDNVSLDELLKE